MSKEWVLGGEVIESDWSLFGDRDELSSVELDITPDLKDAIFGESSKIISAAPAPDEKNDPTGSE